MDTALSNRIDEIKERLRVIEMGLSNNSASKTLVEKRLMLLNELKLHWKNDKDKINFRIY